MSEMLPCTCRHGDEPYCPRHTPLPGERSAVTAPALDVLREYLPSPEHNPPCGVGTCRIPAALADLDALVQAARNYLSSDVWIDGHPLQGKSLGPDTGTTTSEALRDALLRVTGEAR